MSNPGPNDPLVYENIIMSIIHIISLKKYVYQSFHEIPDNKILV